MSLLKAENMKLKNQIEHLVFVDLLGERKLHQDSVDAVVVVELFDEREQLGLGRVGG